MAQINETPLAGRKKVGVGRAKKHILRFDMTPMVDLGFLLITFFVMTAEMSKPKVAKLYMPKEGPPTPVKNSNSLTVLLGNDHVVRYYEGDWTTALQANKIYETTFSVKDGIGKVIRDKQKWLENAKLDKEGRQGLVLMIKPSKYTQYTQVIDMLDEAMINNVTRYMLLSPDEKETKYIEEIINKH